MTLLTLVTLARRGFANVANVANVRAIRLRLSRVPKPARRSDGVPLDTNRKWLSERAKHDQVGKEAKQ